MRVPQTLAAFAFVALLTSCAAPSAAPSPVSTEAAAPTETPEPTSTPTPTPEPGPLASIEVSAAGLTLIDDAGLVIDEVALSEGSAVFDAVLTKYLGEPTSVDEVTEGQCSAPGTTLTRWADVDATLTVSPPTDDFPDPFFVIFGTPETPSDLTVRIPDGPAIGEDADALFNSVPDDQRSGVGAGSMVYDLAPDSDAGSAWGHHGASGYVDHEFVLGALATPGTVNSFYC